MSRTAFAAAVLAAVGLTFADHDGPGKPAVRVLSASDLAEKIDGKKAKGTAVEVTFGPGEASPPHRHPGPVLGYVVEGAYEWAIDDKPVKLLKAGDTFYEPAGCLHRVSKNPGKGRTRVLAWVLHAHDAKDLVIPEKHP